MVNTTQSHPLLNVGGRVLAAVDRSEYAESTAFYASWAAKRLQAPLEFLHVLDRHAEKARVSDLSGNLATDASSRLLDELASIDHAHGKLAQENGRALLRRASDIARNLHGISAETRLRHGSLVDTLTELEADVRLFVLGKRGEHADFAREHLGGELERVVRAVHRPLLVSSRGTQPIERVLVAFDGSATTRKGIEMLAASPLFMGLELKVVMVGDADEAATRQLDWAVSILTSAGIRSTGEILEGDPDQTLINRVREDAIDMLVMGAYGHSRIRHLIVGSTTTVLLRECRIPCLLLR